MSKEVALLPVPFTRFMDMHSGGGCKTDYEYIYIQAPIEKAMTIFEERFGRNPDNVTCDCCGDDYSISESATLEIATGYERGCRWDKAVGDYVEEPGTSYKGYTKLDDYIAQENVLVIYANGIEQ